MRLTLPIAPPRYDQQDQSQTRRLLELFAQRSELALYKENGATARITGGTTPFEIYGPEGQYAGFTRGQLVLYAQDADLEGGEIALIGGPNAAGADFPTWTWDNYSGTLRWFTGGVVNMQLTSPGYLAIIAGTANGAVIEANGGSARIRWIESDQAADEKRWDMLVDAKIFIMRSLNDAESVSTEIFRVTRGTGTAIVGFRLNTHLDWLANNTFDIGTGGNYPRNIGYGTSLTNAGTQILTGRKTGWGAPTGTATRTTFATSTVTLSQLAERVKALIDDLTSHGVIGA